MLWSKQDPYRDWKEEQKNMGNQNDNPVDDKDKEGNSDSDEKEVKENKDTFEDNYKEIEGMPGVYAYDPSIPDENNDEDN